MRRVAEALLAETPPRTRACENEEGIRNHQVQRLEELMVRSQIGQQEKHSNAMTTTR